MTEPYDVTPEEVDEYMKEIGKEPDEPNAVEIYLDHHPELDTSNWE